MTIFTDNNRFKTTISLILHFVCEGNLKEVVWNDVLQLLAKNDVTNIRS